MTGILRCQNVELKEGDDSVGYWGASCPHTEFAYGPEVHISFNLHKFEWMVRDFDAFSEEIIQEFYVSYVATLRGSLDRWARPTKQDPLTSTLVWGCRVDISESTIHSFLYDPTTGTQWAQNTSEFNYR